MKLKFDSTAQSTNIQLHDDIPINKKFAQKFAKEWDMFELIKRNIPVLGITPENFLSNRTFSIKASDTSIFSCIREAISGTSCSNVSYNQSNQAFTDKCREKREDLYKEFNLNNLEEFVSWKLKFLTLNRLLDLKY